MTTTLVTVCVLALAAIGVWAVARARRNRSPEEPETKGITDMLNCDHCGASPLIYHGPAKPVDAVGLDEDEEPEPVESAHHKYECPICEQFSWKHESELMAAVMDEDRGPKSPSWAAKRPESPAVQRLRMIATRGTPERRYGSVSQ